MAAPFYLLYYFSSSYVRVSTVAEQRTVIVKIEYTLKLQKNKL